MRKGKFLIPAGITSLIAVTVQRSTWCLSFKSPKNANKCTHIKMLCYAWPDRSAILVSGSFSPPPDIPSPTNSDVAFPEKYVTENFQEISGNFLLNGKFYLFIMSVWKQLKTLENFFIHLNH